MTEKIEQEAEKYADSKEIRGSSYHSGLRKGYIEGAKFARNTALSEAIEKLEAAGYREGSGEDEEHNSRLLFEILEGLKIKP